MLILLLKETYISDVPCLDVFFRFKIKDEEEFDYKMMMKFDFKINNIRYDIKIPRFNKELNFILSSGVYTKYFYIENIKSYIENDDYEIVIQEEE